MTLAASPSRDARGLLGRLRALRRRLLRGAWMVRFELPLDGVPAGLAAARQGVAVRRARNADRAVLGEMARGREPIADRLARGEVAFVGELGGRPAGCTFLARAPVRLDGYLLSYAPRPGEAYHYGLYVRPEARRRGVAEALSLAVVAEARAAGARVLTCYVDAANRGGRAVQLALGCRPCGRLLALVVAGRVSLVPWRREDRTEVAR